MVTEDTVELKDFLKVITKYKHLIILGTLICLVATIVVTVYTPPTYEASLQLLVSQKQVVVGDSSTAGESYQAILTSERLAKTFSQMIENRSTAEKVIDKLNIPVLPTDLTKRIKAEPIRDTQLINITVQDKNPAQAQQIANTIGVVFKKMVEDIETTNKKTGDSQTLVSISIVEPAIEPTEPVSPRPVLNAVFAFIIGLLVSITLAFLLNYMDTTIKDVDEVERLCGLVSLGQIPKIPKGSNELIVKTEPRSIVAEAFRMLRTNIQYINFESTIKTLVVTSAGVSEGKTLFCANFAAVMARAGYRVLVVGCDLRRPRLHQLFNLSNDVGLANILIGTAGLDKAIQRTDIKDLDIVVSGPTPPNPVDLLESKRMERFLEEVNRRYDFIILDSPPISTITDALVLVSQTDGVLLLARHGVTNRQAFVDAKAALDKVNARVIGFALNASEKTGAYNYYQRAYVEERTEHKPKKRRLGVIVAALVLGGTAITLEAIVKPGALRTVFASLLGKL
ncbi:MAG: polysaccharide biosynthesis tyrosine autokinase [Firmicutes bacterium]|nr:polysaccharide biosynthesis tyrosine autokinase [Bacillota bacterium]